MYTYSPSDSIADFAQAANTIRGMTGIAGLSQRPPVPSLPQMGASVLPDTPENIAMTGIAALMGAGQQMTGTQPPVQRMAEGGLAGLRLGYTYPGAYYTVAMPPISRASFPSIGLPFYGPVIEPGLSALPSGGDPLAGTPSQISVPNQFAPGVSQSVTSALAEAPISLTPEAINAILTQRERQRLAGQEAGSESEGPPATAEYESQYGALGGLASAIGMGLGLGPTSPTSAFALAAKPALEGLFTSPLSITGLITGPNNIFGNKLTRTAEQVAKAQMSADARARQVTGPVGRAIADVLGFTAKNPVTGQTQIYGFGNQNIDKYGNPRGSEMATAAAIGDVAAKAAEAQAKEDAFGSGMTTADEIGGYGYSVDYTQDYGALDPGNSDSDSGSTSSGGDSSGGDVGDDWSDIRLKQDVKYIKNIDGLNQYSWTYKWGGPKKIGVMAHELLTTKYADAVSVVDGYLKVDYTKLPKGVRCAN